MNVLLWHVHGSWTTSLVQGRHRYLLPVLPDRGPDGRGRARTWEWPEAAEEVTPEALRERDVDVVILQRPHEIELVERWLGRHPGRDLPAVYLEHDAPQGEVGAMWHPLAHRSDIPVVHVTHFNDLFWDCGRAPTLVVEHGVVDPGYRYGGDLPRAAVVINEAPRRGRVVGLDLLGRLGAEVPVDLFGMGNAAVASPPAGLHIDDLPQERLHTELPRRRVYVHPYRWTSLGLSLIEAMHLGMPVVALGTTEACEAVPREAGVVSTDLDVLGRAVRRLTDDPEEARERGKAARAAALARYSLERFLSDWDRVFAEVVP
jgi:hypothetical protein